MDADAIGLLSEALRAKGQFLLKVKERAEATPVRYQTPSLEQLSLFTSNLATLLRTGVSLLASLDALARQEKGRGLGIVAERLKGEIGRGLSLADALAKHPRVFTPVYCGVVKAGEKSGSIDLALRDLAAYLSWQDALRGEVRKAVSYPLLLVSGIVALAIFMMTIIAPRFEDLLAAVGGETPASATFFFEGSRAFRESWELLLALALTGLGCFWLSGRAPLLRQWRDGLIVRLPLVGPVAREVALSRFARNLSVLLRSGVSVPQAMSQTRRLVGNASLEKALIVSGRSVERGETIHDSLEATGAFPPLVMTMIGVGEIAGRLTETLETVTEYYDQSAKRAIEKMLAASGPLLTVLLGVLVTWIAITVFSTLYSVIGGLGGAPVSGG
ncbi:MAG: type II secretion system F family protein [Planctomycetota bacterium]